MIKTVTTTDGINAIAFNEFFRYFWIKNNGDTTLYVSAYSNAAANADNTSKLDSGEMIRVENINDFNVYVVGAGTVEVHAQNEIDCPFKSNSKGGETIKTVNGIAPLNKNISLVQGDIPSGKNAYQLPFFVQAGTVTKANPTTVTFPVAYKTVPVVVCTANLTEDSSTSVSGSGYYFKTKVTKTGFTLYSYSASACDNINWVAFGEI